MTAIDNFLNILTAARLGNKECISAILGAFEEKIGKLSGVYWDVPDIKSEMVLEVLEQIKGDKSHTFKVEKLLKGGKKIEADNWSQYVGNKFILWTNLQLNRYAKRLRGKSQVSVYIPLYVSTATKHYNRLLAHLGSHEEVKSFVSGKIDDKGAPTDVCRAKDILAKSLRHKGRKNLLERVRILVSEVSFEPDTHSAYTKPDQEFRILTKEFVLSRPCNVRISERIKSMAKHRLAGTIDQALENEYVYRCGQRLVAPDSSRCRKESGKYRGCIKYDECQEEWKELK